jgi:hypothetical protein
MPTINLITRYLIDPATGHFWSALGWTDQLRNAKQFGTIHEAVVAFEFENLGSADLVLRGGSDEIRIRLQNSVSAGDWRGLPNFQVVSLESA